VIPAPSAVLRGKLVKLGDGCHRELAVIPRQWEGIQTVRERSSPDVCERSPSRGAFHRCSGSGRCRFAGDELHGKFGNHLPANGRAEIRTEGIDRGACRDGRLGRRLQLHVGADGRPPPPPRLRRRRLPWRRTRRCPCGQDAAQDPGRDYGPSARDDSPFGGTRRRPCSIYSPGPGAIIRTGIWRPIRVISGRTLCGYGISLGRSADGADSEGRLLSHGAASSSVLADSPRRAGASRKKPAVWSLGA